MTLSSVLSLAGKEGQHLGKCHPPLPYLPLSKILLSGTKHDQRLQDNINGVWLLAKLPPMRARPFTHSFLGIRHVVESIVATGDIFD